MNKRAIILGGAGLIGSHLAIRLLREGYDVIAIDKRSRSESPLLNVVENINRFHYIKHDITKPYEIGCDELYNLTSNVEYGTQVDYMETQRLSSLGIMNSLDIIAGDKTKVVYASSDDIYNFERNDTKYSSPKQFIANAKRFGESLYCAYNMHYGIDCRIARIFSTYGANSGLRDQHVIGRMIVEALNNQDIVINGNGEQTRSFCWVEDMVTGLVSLMRAHNSEGVLTCDLGSPIQVSVRHIADEIVELTGSKSRIRHIAARAEEPRNKIPDTKGTNKKIGWEATTSLKEGLQRAINYTEKELSAVAMKQMSWIEIYG